MKNILLIILMSFVGALGIKPGHAQPETQSTVHPELHQFKESDSKEPAAAFFNSEISRLEPADIPLLQPAAGAPEIRIPLVLLEDKSLGGLEKDSEGKFSKKDSSIEVISEFSPSEGLLEKVSLDLREMDILDTFRFLSMKGGLNVVASKNVQGRVTLFLRNVAISDVLDVILLTNNLACEKNNDIITIMTDAEYRAIYGKPYSDKRGLRTITLEYADTASLLTVLSNIKSDIGKIIADSVTGTIVLIDIPEKIEEMEKIAKNFDLPTIERIIPTMEETFELSYAKAENIEPEISKSLNKDTGTVRIDKRTNKLIVRDLPHNMERVRKLVKEFDIKTKQVLIEAKIIEVTLSDDFYMGINWKRIFAKAHDLTLANVFPYGSTGASSLALSIGTVAADNYEVAMEFVKTVGKVKIVSSPHIAVCSNEEAAFMVGSREAYVTSTVTTGEVTTTTSESVEFIDVGTNLYITPVINKDGFIKMHIKPEVSSVREWFETSEGNKIPIVDTSNAETEILIKDGKTIIIAGLIKETMMKTVSKVPFLGSIPFAGALFRKVDDVKERKELVMFLTPRIISGEEDMIYIEETKKQRKPFKGTDSSIEAEKKRKPAKK